MVFFLMVRFVFADVKQEEKRNAEAEASNERHDYESEPAGPFETGSCDHPRCKRDYDEGFNDEHEADGILVRRSYDIWAEKRVVQKDPIETKEAESGQEPKDRLVWRHALKDVHASMEFGLGRTAKYAKEVQRALRNTECYVFSAVSHPARFGQRRTRVKSRRWGAVCRVARTAPRAPLR